MQRTDSVSSQACSSAVKPLTRSQPVQIAGADASAPAASYAPKPVGNYSAKAKFKSRKVRQTYQHMAGQVLQNHTAHFDGGKITLQKCLHLYFENTMTSAFMGMIIVINALLVIHETDLKASKTSIPLWLDVTSHIYTFVYLIEISGRLYVYRTSFFRSGWNIIDLMVVITDVCAELTEVWAGSDAPSVSLLRIFRLARLLRLIAMISVFHELQTMLLGFGSAMKAMVWASFMIGVVLTVCSIMAVEFIHPLNLEVAKTGVYGECKRCGRAFETVAESNLTFIQQIIAGDSWGKITIPIMEAYPASGVFFLIVFGVIDLGVLNLILTVIVNAAETARQANIEMQLTEKARQVEEMKVNLKHLCAMLDKSGDGKISLEEFMAGVENVEEFAKALALLDVEKQDAEVIFNLMDEDGSGDVDYNEFVHTMISTRHETTHTKLLFLKAGVNELSKYLKSQSRLLNDHVLRIQGSTELADVVNRAVDDSHANMSMQSEKITAEFERLSQKLDQRWERLERALGDALLQPPAKRDMLLQSSPSSLARKSHISSLPMPTSYTPSLMKQSHLFSGSWVPTPDPSGKTKSPSCAKQMGITGFAASDTDSRASTSDAGCINEPERVASGSPTSDIL